MQPRSVPQHIDRSGRALEYALAFMLPLVFIRPFHEGLGYLLAIVITPIYIKLTLGKPAGFLQHMLYRIGLPMPGLLNRKIKQFRR